MVMLVYQRVKPLKRCQLRQGSGRTLSKVLTVALLLHRTKGTEPTGFGVLVITTSSGCFRPIGEPEKLISLAVKLMIYLWIWFELERPGWFLKSVNMDEHMPSLPTPPHGVTARRLCSWCSSPCLHGWPEVTDANQALQFKNTLDLAVHTLAEPKGNSWRWCTWSLV